jgi:hypothetical protein
MRLRTHFKLKPKPVDVSTFAYSAQTTQILHVALQQHDAWRLKRQKRLTRIFSRETKTKRGVSNMDGEISIMPNIITLIKVCSSQDVHVEDRMYTDVNTCGTKRKPCVPLR